MNELWSYSTTVREAERIVGFLRTAKRLDGQIWDKNCMIKFQTMLIQDRQYLNDVTNTQTTNKLSPEQINILGNPDRIITFDEAKKIFEAKEYNDPPMRGRQSMAPLIKLGLAYYSGTPKKIFISDLGNKVLDGEISIEDFFLDSLLKFQYPNPVDKDWIEYNTKPFINAMRLVREVNKLCREKGLKEKGIHKTEFGIFVLSLKNYKDVPSVAKKILSFRKQYESYSLPKERKLFVDNYIKEYLSNYKEPIKNTKEYTDNIIRYLRMTKYFIVRGKYEYIYYDLEPLRKTEIDSILNNDDGSAIIFNTLDDWQNYIGRYGSYYLPFEENNLLRKIYSDLKEDILKMSKTLGISPKKFESFSESKTKNKKTIQIMREHRTALQNLLIKREYYNNEEKINETIEMLKHIRKRELEHLTYRPSLELEKWINIALNIINDCIEIKPNTLVGDDNEPISTAPAKKADIECYYEDFNAICEVTTLTGRDQWYNEAQPIMRHLRDFENANDKCYCLFVAPRLHPDCLNQLFVSVKYGYDGKKQHFIPITIEQLEILLDMIKHMQVKDKVFNHEMLREFYDECNNVENINGYTEWYDHVCKTLNNLVFATI